MNRHARRAAAAKARRTGYHHRLLTAVNALDIRPGELSHITVKHEENCTFDKGCCTCRPNFIRRSGTWVQVIGDDGHVEEIPVS